MLKRAEDREIFRWCRQERPRDALRLPSSGPCGFRLGEILLVQAVLGRLERHPARFGGISVALLCDDTRELLRL